MLTLTVTGILTSHTWNRLVVSCRTVDVIASFFLVSSANDVSMSITAGEYDYGDGRVEVTRYDDNVVWICLVASDARCATFDADDTSYSTFYALGGDQPTQTQIALDGDGFCYHSSSATK